MLTSYALNKHIYLAFSDVIFYNVTNKTWAYSKVWGIFRISFAKKKPTLIKSFLKDTMQLFLLNLQFSLNA